MIENGELPNIINKTPKKESARKKAQSHHFPITEIELWDLATARPALRFN